MIRFSFLVLALVVTVSAVADSFAQENAPSQQQTRAAANAPIADGERPMSIFNDKVRRFKFELEETLITAELAEDFMASYKGRNQPAILGAYADVETNSLAVISSPEAEEAIRTHLAQWMVDRQGLFTPPLKVQKRTLEHRRRSLLQEMAQLEVQAVEVENGKGEQLQARLAKFKTELNVVERQIEIVNRYLALLDDAPTSEAKTAAAR